MASARLEQRVAALEAAIAKLQRKIEEREPSKPWWEQIAGTFENDLIYEHAMRLGQQYRQSLGRHHLRDVRSSRRAMVVLDTDLLSVLERGDQSRGVALRARLASLSPAEVVTTIINYEEQMRGWLAYLARTRSVAHQVDAYRRRLQHLDNYRRIPVLPFDEAAAVTFQQLRRARLRIGTMDLKIAAIVVSCNATLLSRNLADFRQVPGLQVEDWTV